MASIFTKIINGEIPCYKVLEDEHTFAILDIRPINPGHCIIFPKQEVDHFFDVEDPAYTQVFINAKKIAKAMKKVTGCKRVGSIIQGFEVPHFHLHLFPMNGPSDLSFANAKQRDESIMKEMHQKICEALEN